MILLMGMLGCVFVSFDGLLWLINFWGLVYLFDFDLCYWLLI